jgi:hypothetical protein
MALTWGFRRHATAVITSLEVGTTDHSPLKLHVGIVRLGNALPPGGLHYQSI